MLRKLCQGILGVSLFLSLVGEGQAQSPRGGWQEAIDATWGDGESAKEKLRLFDAFWVQADTAFAAFHNLDIDWDLIREQYRSEIEDGVSRGRFAAIMNHMALALREAHTFAIDSLVNAKTEPEHGVPLLHGAVWGNNGHFGACLTPLPDSTLLVYDAIEGHPLGLARGDIVLGYDGSLWKDLYPQLLNAELPLYLGERQVDGYRWNQATWRSAPSAYQHGWLNAAGLNWHLFSELDVLRYPSGEVVSVSVASLVGRDMFIHCSEQLPVPGIAFPEVIEDEYFSWGVIEGTRIGYVYAWSWYWGDPSPQDAFRQAVEELMLVQDVEALIMDFRFNHGGIAHWSNDGFALLFDETVETLGMALRSDPADRYAMEPTSCCVPFLDIPGDPATYFDRPIAVLTGPGGFSAGDYTPTRLRYHPHARFFGKTTSSSFSPGENVHFDHPEWVGAVSFLEAYRLDTPGVYLTHTERPVDEAVWLTQEDVVLGEDTVVRAALGWIKQTVNIEPSLLPEAFALSPNYPNPFSGVTRFDVTVTRPGPVTVVVYDLLGRRVQTLMDGEVARGVYSLSFNADGLASGVYVYAVRGNGQELHRKMAVMR